MNVIVFGAGGKTGTLVVEKAVAAGHTVTAFLHSAAKSPLPGVRIVTGDAGDPIAVQNGIAGQHAVIDTIGGKTPYKDSDVERAAAQNIVDAMRAEQVRRLIVVSAMGVGDSAEQAPFWYEYLLLPTFLRGSTKDKAGMEDTVHASGLEFVIARPPVLNEDAAIGSVKVVPAGGKGHKITRSDLAQFLVDQLAGNQYLGQAVVIANS